jgi:hypothetical protein
MGASWEAIAGICVAVVMFAGSVYYRISYRAEAGTEFTAAKSAQSKPIVP